jgi:hypothetical protein
MRKFLIFSVVMIGLTFGGYHATPWIMGWTVNSSCPEEILDPECFGRLRDMGHAWAERDNLDRAGRWYLRGARAGDAQAMFHLGWVYQQIAQTLRQVEDQRRLARNIGLPSADPNVHLSSLESRDADTRKYAEAAIAWYRKSADSGFAPSMNNLGLMHSLGLDGRADDEKAFRWYLAAAQAGNPIGSMNLIMSYQLGRGTLRDPEEAAKWSLWRPAHGLTSDLERPTLRRTLLAGRPERPARVGDRLRSAARAGKPVVLQVSPMRHNKTLPAVAEAEKQSPTKLQ